MKKMIKRLGVVSVSLILCLCGFVLTHETIVHADTINDYPNVLDVGGNPTKAIIRQIKKFQLTSIPIFQT
ncbi:hypothetical protein OFW50_01810 [Lacticaseibacillus chiayiensis]|uniref:Uncharacterized protein n=1 Tax=Lacticaseibacillus chiayiensis TaxID=2100821 RepID=A0ABY6H6V4_9LACO|nr:hypothetical protein [Lacticaseibacillus chiayiensis]UYN56863.1 hypothetical protein OFW50_01810 [Lacticaseibacillus chiayiensis]